jgi:hypothetical protein
MGSRRAQHQTLALRIISRACAGVMRGTAALATSIICFTLEVMTFLQSIDDVRFITKADICGATTDVRFASGK